MPLHALSSPLHVEQGRAARLVPVLTAATALLAIAATIALGTVLVAEAVVAVAVLVPIVLGGVVLLGREEG